MTDAVLVTGATGFIGRHLVLELLACGDRVFALTRAANGSSAKERLMRALRTAHGSSLPGQMQANLEAVEGDLVLPGLGLPRRVQERLAAEVGQVLHCGGDTRFYPKDRAAHRAVHLDGPLNTLRMIDQGRGVRFHHVSTAYIAGMRNGTAYEDELDVGQAFRNPYERIKLEAERTIRTACEAREIPLTIFRPSIVVADPRSPNSNWSDPISTRFAAFARLCRLYKRTIGRIRGLRPSLRIRGSSESVLNVVPITYVVQAMLAISAAARERTLTFHLVDPAPPRNRELLDQVTAMLGVAGLEPFEDRTLPMEGMTLLERVAENLLRPYQDYFFESPTFDDRYARQFLDGRVEPRSAVAIEFLARAVDARRTTKSGSDLLRSIHAEDRTPNRVSDLFS